MKKSNIDADLEEVFGPTKPKSSKPSKFGEIPRSVSDCTRLARELYLWGGDDGRPVRSMDRLAILSGASARTLEKYMAVWRKESEDLARATAGTRGQAARVTVEIVARQAEMTLALQVEMERLKLLIPSLPAGSDMHRDTLKLLSATLARWEVSSGFAAYADLQATIAKEQVKTAARASSRDTEHPIRQASGFSFDINPKELPPS